MLDSTTSSSKPAVKAVPDLTGIKTTQQFAAQVITRADLSRKASKVAVDKVKNAAAKEFAGYELLEAETVVQVLQDLGTVLPPMSEETKQTLDDISNKSAGAAFDTAYMTAEYENHAFLLSLAKAFIANSDPSSPAEATGRALAKVTVFAFTEHTGVSRRILKEMAA
jgi:putative membrane protein